jgi:hypothetical protein
MEKFVHRQNLEHFVERLETETAPRARNVLMSLLIEEEDRFGTWSQRADQADCYIARGEAQIRRQEEALAMLRPDDPKAPVAGRVLTNLRQIVAILEAYRRGLEEPPSELS